MTMRSRKEEKIMGGYILCQVKKANMPYYIENISTNIFTIEELCYYLHHNIYLLDETIINEQLCDWLRNQLGLEKLYHRLYKILEEEQSIGNFILPIFKEINYLDLGEFKELNRRLEVLEEQPVVIRQKRKGDFLIENGMYINAIKIYEKAILEAEGTKLGGQFTGSIYHNMGCAYLHLFQWEEGSAYLRKAYEELRTKESLKQYLIAFYKCKPLQEWKNECDRMGVDEVTKSEILNEIKETKVQREEVECTSLEADEIMERLTKEYHRNTGS